MEQYERIPYSSFCWKFGTTSFRTKGFNKMIEWQLRLLNDFWQMPENQDMGWKIAKEGQNDIYEIKNRYYDWLVLNGFTKGNDATKYKAAREKTSGLYDMGLIDNEHRLTDVGHALLNIAEKQDYFETTQLGISKDSQIYLKQLLKLSDGNTDTVVRPFIIVLYLLHEFKFLTYDEFRYLMPLCTDEATTSFVLQSIRGLRQREGNIDNILKKILLSKENYREGLKRFINNDFSENLLLSVGMNRKSPKYDKLYVPLFNHMHAVYMEKSRTNIIPLFKSLENFQSSIAIKWKQMMFDTSNKRTIENEPTSHLIPLEESCTSSEEAFKQFFYLTMHINKAKATLEDYFDLNRRYLGLTNCFVFEEDHVKLDIVPKQFFGAAIEQLYQQAYESSELLFVNSTLEQICPALRFNEQAVIDGLRKELDASITTIEEVRDKVDRVKYERFNRLIEKEFTNEKLLKLLDDFEQRRDDEINRIVTDNADIPTIFEYILGIIWYKVSERTGKVLNYMKLSLDANLLPVTHAAGGEADIVYEYSQTEDYPAHNVLLEATLADGTNQRRMEMEPVSRHVGNHILMTDNDKSYGIFVTTYLHANVLSDFKCSIYKLLYINIL